MEKIYLGKLQHQIYSYIKDKERVSIHDVVNFLENSRNYNTVMTVMTRMVEAGHLSREKYGRRYLYFINKEKKNKLTSLLDGIKKSVFKGSTVSFVSYLLQENEELSENQIQELSTLIKDIKKGKNDLDAFNS